jgi:hypothetical protein
MHWERKNVNPMLALRVGECNDRWDETMEQAFRQRLLTRKSQRFARQGARYDKLEQKVLKTMLHLLLLASPSKPKEAQVPISSSQTDIVPTTPVEASPAKTHIPAKTHPWRRYPRAKK